MFFLFLVLIIDVKIFIFIVRLIDVRLKWQDKGSHHNKWLQWPYFLQHGDINNYDELSFYGLRSLRIHRLQISVEEVHTAFISAN